MAVSAEVLIVELYNRGRNGKAQTFASATLAEHERIDSDKIAVYIDQGTATVSWIESCIRLNVEHRIVGFRLPCNGTDDSHSDRIARSSRLPICKAPLALAHTNIVSEGASRQV